MRYLLILLTLVYSTITIAQNKLALIVAVGEYPIESKIKPIASVNDIKYLKTALGRNGFEE